MRATWTRAVLALSLMLVFGACESSTKSGDDGKDAGGTGASNGDSSNGDANANNGNGGEDAGNSSGMDSSMPMAGTGSVAGFVYDTSPQPQALAGVKITGPNGETATTDATGAYMLEGVGAAEDVALLATVDSYTAGIRNVGVVKDQKSFVSFFLKQTYKGSVDAQRGGLVRSPLSGAAVRFKGGSLVKKKDGSAAEGKVNVEITPIDSTNAAELKAFPGHSQAKNSENKSGLLETYVPMEVKAKNAAGDDLQVKQNETATYEFPIPRGLASVPDTIDVWSLDEKTGVWTFEGEAKKGKNDENQDVYTAEVKHMSWWTCDAFIDNITCVRGCVKTAGEPVVGSLVTFTGLGFRFRETESTDEQGCFYANLQQDSGVSVYAADATGFSAATTITTDKLSKRWEDGKDACQEIADLTVVPAPVGSTCPAGYSDCGGRCYDLQNDSAYCGASCETAGYCTGRDAVGSPLGPLGSVCEQGQCECPAGWLTCPAPRGVGDFCVNSLRDREQCGTTCENLTFCEANELCLNGACTALTCTAPNDLCATSQYEDPYCSNLNIDANNCGSCGTPCGNRGDTQTNDGSFVCTAGECGCEADLTICGYALPPSNPYSYTCEDITNSPDNCGGCYALGDIINEARSCPDSQACVNSMCADISCGAGQDACGHACIDTLNDSNNCGACNAYCNGGTSCVNGDCVCPANETLCPGVEIAACVNTSTDERQCGACSNAGGVSCDVGTECLAGVCTPIVCSGSLTLCGNDCVDLASDENNCKECGLYCPGTCGAAGCACSAGQQLCCPTLNPYCTADTAACFCGE